MSLQPVVRVGIAIAGALAVCQSAFAQTVLYANFETSQTFPYGRSGYAVSNDYNTGSRITSFATGALGSVLAPVVVGCHYVATECEVPSAGTTMQIWVDVLADNNDVPGALLARSSTITVSTAGALQSFVFGAGTALAAGASYWIKSGTLSPNEFGAGWQLASSGVGPVGLWRGSSFDQFSGTPHALKVLSPVPEPAQWALFSMALLGLTIRQNGAHMLRRLLLLLPSARPAAA